MTVGSLFSGIGGLELGLERAGMEVRWQVEIDEYCRRVLSKQWPDASRYEDVREVGAHNLEPVDLIAGGFPCQDISVPGQGAGIEGERSGLWFEFARIIRELRPRFVLVENVPALTLRGLDRVLGDLAEGGYDAEWDCIPAAAVGAPHLRDRLFIVGYTRGEWVDIVLNGCSKEGGGQASPTRPLYLSDAGGSILRQGWLPEPDVGRVVDGVPNRVDRLRGLGNAVVPQVAEWIGRRIMEVAGYVL